MNTYLTIDFEDFSHDLGRHLHLDPPLSMRLDALYKAYFDINNLVNKIGNGTKITFFVTGILAEKLPDLIRQISEDGHEIACHYHYHEAMRCQDIKYVEKNLKLAIEKLENASNAKVLGFRAPYFKINKSSQEQYQLIEKLFVYDSSLSVSSKNALETFYLRMGLKKLYILPVFEDKIGPLKMKTGGTYTKIFPKSFSKTLLKKNKSACLDTILYFHPYEFSNGNDWRISLTQMSNMPKMNKYYWMMRQTQWLNVGNKSLEAKIIHLLKGQSLSGCLSEKFEHTNNDIDTESFRPLF